MRRIRSLRFVALVTLALVQLTGCATWSNKTKGAAAGATAGAVVGGVIGNQTGSTTRGAIIGAVVGGTVGAVIGHQMDQQAKEIQQNIPGAIVTRVGEGIAVTFASGLLYDFDSDAIKPTAAQNLSTLAASLDKYPNTDILIVGHTDATGRTRTTWGCPSVARVQRSATWLAGACRRGVFVRPAAARVSRLRRMIPSQANRRIAGSKSRSTPTIALAILDASGCQKAERSRNISPQGTQRSQGNSL